MWRGYIFTFTLTVKEKIDKIPNYFYYVHFLNITSQVSVIRGFYNLVLKTGHHNNLIIIMEWEDW